MSDGRTMTNLDDVVSLATLRRTRALLRTRRGRLAVAGISVAYLLVSMLIGQMMTFPTLQGRALVDVKLSGDPAWDFPELFLFTSGFAVDLFFLPTLTMVLVSLGVGIGATAAMFTVAPRLRGHSTGTGRAARVTSTAGASTAVVGLATMGACCCTSCAGTLGVAVIAAASGTSTAGLLRESWYLDLFQFVVVAVALLAQERALRPSSDSCPVPPRIDGRFVVGALLRISLLIAGITWSLAMFVEWIYKPPLSATPFMWYHWIFEHQALSAVAIAAGMFPKELARWIRRLYRNLEGWALRVVLLEAGITWGIWVPPVMTGLGLGGLLNEILSFFLVPVSWGAVAPDSALGPALVFHWIFQHALLAGFAILVAVRPDVALAPLMATVEGAGPDPVGRTTVNVEP